MGRRAKGAGELTGTWLGRIRSATSTAEARTVLSTARGAEAERLISGRELSAIERATERRIKELI
jgi:hypothetical protein